MPQASKILIIAGMVLILAGLIWWAVPRSWPIGRLPGDILIEKPGIRFYFPLTTGLLLSLLLSAILYLARYLKG